MNKIFTIFFLSAILFGCNKNETPKPDSSGMFVKFFGGAFADEGYSIVESGDGGFYVAGCTVQPSRIDTNIMVVKIDPNGNKVWERKYSFDTPFDEVATDVLVDADGNLIVSGYVKKTKDQDADMLFMWINKDNPDDVDTTSFGVSKIDDRAYNIIEDEPGSYILYGSTKNASNDLDFYITKVAFDNSTKRANLLWNRQVGAFSQKDMVGTIKTAGSNQLVFCGSTYRTDNNASNMMLALSDNHGNLLWNYRYNENDRIDQFGYDMVNLVDGYVVAGSINRGEDKTSIKDIFLVKTDLDGTVSNSKNKIVIPGSGSQEAYSIIALDNSTFLITGYTTVNGKKDIYVAKVNDQGNVLASQTFGGGGDDEGHKIIRAKDGGFVIVGTVEAANNTMMAVYKLNIDLKLVH